MFKTAIITGSTGWIGSTLVDYLSTNYKDIKICKTDREMHLQSSVEGEVTLFHFAFPTKDRVSGMTLEEYKNSVLTLRGRIINLIEATNVAKMVYVSSGAVYKLGTNNFVENYEEDPYGFLKLEEEMIFTEIAKQKGIKLVIPRLFALAGGFINKPEAYLLANFILQASKTGEIKINAKSRVFRSYIHIYDLFEICLKYFDSNLSSPCIFDTKGDEVLELNDVAFYISKSLGLNIKITRDFDFTINENKYFAQNDSCKNITKLLHIGQLQSFEDCILDTKNNL